MKQQTDPSSIFANWKRDQAYKQKMGFTSDWPNFVNFKEGKQWPARVVAKWKNFTFMTINQCDFIVESKKSNILAQNIKNVFKPKDVPQEMDEEMEASILEKAKDYTDLAANTWVDVGQNQLNNDAVDAALTIGTGVYHYYYDKTFTGGEYVPTKGRIGAHTVDAMDIALGNPHLRPHEIQKQPYIILKTYENVDEVKEYAKNNGSDYLLIVADADNDEEYESGKNDLEQPNKVVCLTMYYKENGGVQWTKVTRSATVQKTRSLSPTERPFKLYPVRLLVFKARYKSSYGRSILEDVISVQKGINFLYSMIAYGVQQTAWPKILAKAGALIQAITNEPGEVVTDNDKNSPGDSIKYMQPPNFSNMPPLLIDKLTESMRQTTNTGDVISGETLGANMAVGTVMALQNQAKKPNEMYVKQLNDSMKHVGKIEEEFFKCYYILPRSVVSEDKEGKMVSKIFTPSDYADMEFELEVDCGAGGEFSEPLQMAFIQPMFDKGAIDKYQYVKYSPKSLVPVGMAQDFEDEQQALKEQQEQMAQQGAQVDDVMSQLTPEEQQALQADPSLMEGLV